MLYNLSLLQTQGALAQLASALPWHGRGQGFESLMLHHVINSPCGYFFVYFNQMIKKPGDLVKLAWGTTLGAVLVVFVAWGQYLGWNMDALSVYTLFPLFGLTAFSIMWSHYIVAAKRKYLGFPKEVTKDYFEKTSWAALVAFTLHPGLLIWQLWRDGMGLPPNSYLTYVGPALKGAVALGSISLLIFLAYEFHRKFGKKSWWKYVQYLSDVAMFAIFYHGLKLGGNLQSGWFRYVWYFYGLSLVISIIYIYFGKQKNRLAK